MGLGQVGQGPHGDDVRTAGQGVHRLVDDGRDRAVVVAGDQQGGHARQLAETIFETPFFGIVIPKSISANSMLFLL